MCMFTSALQFNPSTLNYVRRSVSEFAEMLGSAPIVFYAHSIGNGGRDLVLKAPFATSDERCQGWLLSSSEYLYYPRALAAALDEAGINYVIHGHSMSSGDVISNVQQ